MRTDNPASLLPKGEGQDEGKINFKRLEFHFLTPTHLPEGVLVCESAILVAVFPIRIEMAGGRASQKPEAGISVTPSSISMRRLQPMDLGSAPGSDFSSSEIVRPHMNNITPKRTNQTTAPVIGSVPTVLITPRLTIETSTSLKIAMANAVCTAETTINQYPLHCFM